jgi:hypothetical protein
VVAVQIPAPIFAAPVFAAAESASSRAASRSALYFRPDSIVVLAKSGFAVYLAAVQQRQAMFRHFFAAPDFLAMLRLWEASRIASGPAVWNGDLALVPAELRPNLIVVDWLGAPRYRYVGSECIARFGADPTGHPVLATLGGGAYAAYVGSLGDEAIARAQPIFSTSVFEFGEELMVSGRLFAPFGDAVGKPPGMILSVQLFSRTEFKLRAVAQSGFVNESRRVLIAGVPELCVQLEEAQRYHRLSRAVAGRPQSIEWAEIARRLSGNALVALQPFRAAIG